MNYKLIINNQNVEIENAELSNVSIALTKQYESLSNPTLYFSEWSKSISVPFTSVNNKIFANVFKTDSVLTTKDLDITKKIDFVLLCNSEIICRGYCKLTNIVNADKNKYYQLSLFSNLGNLLKEMQNFTFFTNTDVDSKYIIPNPLSKDCTLNRNIVKESFEKEKCNQTNRTDLDYIGFFPMYQGKYNNFDSDKIEVSGAITELGFSADEHFMREFRSYYQGCYVWVNSLFDMVKKKLEEITDYRLNLDKSWFNSNNPYWANTIYTCPTLFDESGENENGVQKEGFGLYPKVYRNSIRKNSDLSNSHSSIIDFKHINGDYIYNPETKLFTPSGNSCHFKAQLSYTLLAHNIDDGEIFNSYCRIKDDNALFLKIKAVDVDGNDILGANTTYMFYSGENDRLTQTDKFDYALDIGITNRDYPRIITMPDTALGKSDGYYWGGDIIADFEVRTDKEFFIAIDVYCANNGDIFEKSISEYVPKWDWLWSDFFEVGGLTWYVDCVEANIEQTINVRSNSKITMERVWSREETIYDVLIKYCKMFHLMFTLDEDTKTLNICTRDKYFSDYKILDWTNKVDRLKDFTIKPIWFEDRYLVFGYNEGKGQRYDYYQSKYKATYGQIKVDTNYDFNNNEKLLIENLNSSMVTTKKQSCRYINTNNPNEGNFKGYGYKILPKEIYVENDNNESNANNYGSFYFHNGTYSVDGNLSIKDTNGKPFVYITDDSQLQIKQNTFCWGGSIEAVTCYSLPYISTYDRSNKYSIHFAEPKELYFNKEMIGYNTPEYIYNLFWDNYLQEIYNNTNKYLVCYLYINPNEYKLDFKNFILIDNILYRINKFCDFDYSTSLQQSTKVELLQVADISAYTTTKFKYPYLYTENETINITTNDVVEKVFTSTDWKIDYKPLWLNCFKDKNNLIVQGMQPINTKRNGIIILSNLEGVRYSLNVTQEAIETHLTIDKNTITFQCDGGSTRIGVNSYPNNITVSDKPTWIETQFNNSLFGTVLVVSATTNNIALSRSGYITITNGFDTLKIRVAQQGRAIITTIDSSGTAITTKPLVVPDGGTTITTTLNKPIDTNTIVISGNDVIKPTTNIGDIQLKVQPIVTEKNSSGGTIKFVGVDGLPTIIDFNCGVIDKRYTVLINGKVLVNDTEYQPYYENVLEGENLTVTAIENDNKIFLKWSDDNTDNPRQLTVNRDITIYPIFDNSNNENGYLYDNGVSVLFDNNEIIDYI